jgi:rhamnosyltransferase
LETNRVFILMGTYNGELYLKDQIRSVQNQTYRSWVLFIRDDGSVDDTINILNTYQQKDARIQIVLDNKGNLGTLGNYNELCSVALKNNANTVFFCDQDDVWMPDKIKTQIESIQEIEAMHGKDCPILVHTDLTVVDTRLKRIHKSFLAYHGVRNVNEKSLCTLLAQNYITACASTINRALLNIATPIPEEALMHDWWFALCAAACGQIMYIETPMTLYRQHYNNTIGAKGLLNSLNPFRNNIKARWREGHKNFIQSIHQADRLKKRIEDQISSEYPGVLKYIDTYTNCLKMGRFKRLLAIRRNGIQRQGILYQIFFYIFLLLSSDSPKTHR